MPPKSQPSIQSNTTQTRKPKKAQVVSADVEADFVALLVDGCCVIS